MSMNAFELMATLTLNKDEYDKNLSDAENKGNQFGNTLSNAGQIAAVGLGAAVAAATAVSAALVKGVNDVAGYGDNVDKMSQKMGITSKAYQEWDAVMKHCGTSIDALKPSMKTMANQAQQGAEEFQKLGISQEEVKTLSQEDLFGRVIEGLQNMEEGTERTAIASKLLGRGATELGALLNTSAEDTQKMKVRVNELGGVMSADAVKASAAFKDSLQDLQTSFDGLKRNLLGSFMPSMTKVMDGLTDIMAGNFDKGLDAVNEGVDEFIKKMNDVVPQMLEVGGKIIKAIATAITSNLPQIIEAGVKIIVELAVGIVKTIPDLLKAIGSALKKEAGIIGGVLGGIADLLGDIFDFILEHKDAIIGAIVAITAAFVGFKAALAIQSLLPAISSGLAFLVTSLIAAGGATEFFAGAVEALSTVIETNLVGIIIGAIAIIGVFIYHLATEEEAVKSLDEAQKNHEETVKNLTSAQSSYIDSLKGLTDAQNQLAKAQEETGLSGEELYNQFMQNKDSYMQMSPEQQRVLDLYIQMQEKQQSLKDSTEELANAQREEMVAGLQEQASAIKENGGSWDEYKQNVINAFEQQKISQDEAKQLLGEAMSEMSSDAQVAFMQDIPNDIKDGLNPSNYETDWQGFKNTWDGFWNLLTGKSDASFSDVISQSKMSVNGVQFSWSDVGNWFSDRWNDISGAFSGAADWFGFVFGVAKDNVSNAWNNIGEFFSGIWEDIKSAFDFSDALEWGKHMIDNFVQGIKEKWDELKQGVSDTAQTISNFFEHTTPKEGPLKDDDVWTKHMMDNFIGGIDSSKGKLKKSITSVADMMAEPMTMNVENVDGTFGTFGNGKTSIKEEFSLTMESQKDAIDELSYQVALIRKSLGRGVSLDLNKREFGRLVNEVS